MLFLVGAVSLGGVGFVLFTPQPAARTMADLRDAGITDGQRFILTCPERITANTRVRINRIQPGLLRPRQAYATISRVAVCFNPDGGNCWRPSDGLVRVSDMQGSVIVPSLRQDMTGATADAGIDDAGEDTVVDDSLQREGCVVTTCPNADAGGLFSNAPCGNLNRLWLVDSPCRIPNCWVGDGGSWVDDAVVNCRRRNPPPFGDGGFRWAGCNVMPASESSGPDCVPSECSVISGSNPFEDL